jgi:hypothetical protein
MKRHGSLTPFEFEAAMAEKRAKGVRVFAGFSWVLTHWWAKRRHLNH